VKWGPRQAASMIGNPCTDYGIDKELQEKLSKIRTDLDSFTEVEADSLMLSGYLITRKELEKLNARHIADHESGAWGGFSIGSSVDWPFLKRETQGRRNLLKDLLGQQADQSQARNDLARQLDASASVMFKAWKLSPFLRVAMWALVVVLTGAAGWGLWRWYLASGGKITLHYETTLVAVVLAVVMFFVPALKWWRPAEVLRERLVELGFALFGAIIAWAHLCIFDRIFLRHGKLKRLQSLK
jgi:hypothetical protein